MEVSKKALDMIKHHEGVRLRPYRCPAALWTIGVGHVMYPGQARMKLEERKAFQIRLEDFRPFTMEEVDALLTADLGRFEQGVARLCPASVDNQNQFDALVSHSYNTGGSDTLFHLINKNKGKEKIRDWFENTYISANGKLLNGLIARRKSEANLYFSNEI